MTEGRIKKQFLRFSQPVGDFYMITAKVSEILGSLESIERKYDVETNSYFGGIERRQSKSRIKDIAKYIQENPNVMFPTPIIIAARTESLGDEDACVFIEDGFLFIDCSKKLEIIDGQHRIEGIRRALSECTTEEIRRKIEQIELPIVFVLDADKWDRALIFATINGNQRSVSASFIYDLFGLQEERSYEKVSNTIIHALNQKQGGPLYRKIKILGYKANDEAMVSQAIFSKFIIKFMQDEKSYFGRLYQREEDDSIAKILNNIFSAIAETWQDEWGNSNYILTKSIGITGILDSLPTVIDYGYFKKDLKVDTLKPIFEKVKKKLEKGSKTLDGKSFQSQKGANEFRDYIKGTFNEEFKKMNKEKN